MSRAPHTGAGTAPVPGHARPFRRFACRSRRTLANAVKATVLLAGCSVNDVGLVEARTIRADGAEVYQTAAFGMHLDTRHGGARLSLGFVRSDDVAGPHCDTKPGIRDESGRPEAPLARTYLSFDRLLGLQVEAGPQRLAVVLGARDRLAVLAPPGHASIGRAIFFDPHRVGSTRFRCM